MFITTKPTIAIYSSHSNNLPKQFLSEGFSLGTFFGQLNCNLILPNPSLSFYSKAIIEGLLIQKKDKNHTFCNEPEKKINNSDILLFLPGDLQTLTELIFCINYNKTLKTAKPIIIYDFLNFYSNLLNWFEEISLINIIENTGDLFCICRSINELNYFFQEG